MSTTVRCASRVIAVGVVMVVSACGGSGATSSAAKPTAPTGGRTLGAQVCAAYLRATKSAVQPSVQARDALTELARIHPTAAQRAKLRNVVDAYREVERVWTDPAPTTPAAFSQAARAASLQYGKAAQAAGVDPCPRPDTGTTTTTGAAPTTPTWALNTVDRPTTGDGLWVYFDATCPTGTKVTGVTSPWAANPGAPDVSFAALVSGLPAAAPFTAVAADEAFAHKPAFTGTCA